MDSRFTEKSRAILKCAHDIALCQVRLEKISATLFEVTVNRKKSFLNRRKNCAIYISDSIANCCHDRLAIYKKVWYNKGNICVNIFGAALHKTCA